MKLGTASFIPGAAGNAAKVGSGSRGVSMSATAKIFAVSDVRGLLVAIVICRLPFCNARAMARASLLTWFSQLFMRSRMRRMSRIIAIWMTSATTSNQNRYDTPAIGPLMEASKT